MLVLCPSSKSHFLRPRVKHFWFASSPKSVHAIWPVIYFGCRDNHERPGFLRKDRRTSFVDIAKDDAELLSGFSSTTRYEIKRAQKAIDSFMLVVKPSAYIAASSLSAVREMSYSDNMASHALTLPGGSVIEHQYIVDRQAKRVHLYKSSSGFESLLDRSERNAISRCNRLLHYLDMKYYRELGFTVYDFGGIAHAPPGTKLGNIDSFKLGFRGAVVEESVYISMSIVCYNRIVNGKLTTA